MIAADPIENDIVKEEYVLGDNTFESYSDLNNGNTGGLRVKAVSEINKNINKNSKSVTNVQGKPTMEGKEIVATSSSGVKQKLEAKEIVATSSSGLKRKLVVWMVKKPLGTPNTETTNIQLKDFNGTSSSSDNISKKIKIETATQAKNSESDAVVEKDATTESAKEVTNNTTPENQTIEDVEILSDESGDDDDNNTNGETNNSSTTSLRQSVRYFPQSNRPKDKSHVKQYEKMVALLKKRPDVAQGTAKLDVQNFWESAALQLNSLGQPVRSAAHWKKIWLGLKENITTKMLANKTNGTKKHVFTDFEESIISIIGTNIPDVDKNNDKEVVPEVTVKLTSDERISILMQKLITLKKEYYEKTLNMLERQISKADEISGSLRRLNRTHEKAFDIKAEKLREVQRHNYKMEGFRKKELELMQKRIEIETKKLNV